MNPLLLFYLLGMFDHDENEKSNTPAPDDDIDLWAIIAGIVIGLAIPGIAWLIAMHI